MVDIPILYEDENIVVINKPVGVVVTPGAGYEEADTLVGWLIKHAGEGIRQVGVEAHRPGIVHRLDKDTSGVMIMAKTQAAFEHLISQFVSRKVEKKYVALVWGNLVKDIRLQERQTQQFVIDAPIGRNPHNRQRFAVVANGRPAVTRFTVLKNFRINDQFYTFVNCYPKTGRTHQIRVHLKSFSYGIVGDPLYASHKARKRLALMVRHKRLYPRMYLHAHKLKLIGPDGQLREFVAPVPREFIKLKVHIQKK